MNGTPRTIYISRLNDEIEDFEKLFRIYDQVFKSNEDIVLDFSKCSFFRHNAVAFLGGIIRKTLGQNRNVSVNMESIPIKVKENLINNGFFNEMGLIKEERNSPGNSIPYKEMQELDDEFVVGYLNDKWLGRGWINISEELANEIIGNVYEIFTNAFEHSESKHGVFICGQRYPKLNQLRFTLVDFGKGIPKNVKEYLDDPHMPVETALRWAMVKRNSTRRNTEYEGGLGLDVLGSFIENNHGKLEIYSEEGYLLLDDEGISTQVVSGFFPGTIINISFNCDEKYYTF